VQYLLSVGIDTFVEAGTGIVRGGLVKRIAEGMTILPLGNPQDFAAL
jgi:[acyl-carrier-protein] S-malonyltransferase